MSEVVIIHIRRGLTSKQLNITGWKTGEYSEADNQGQRKRIIINPTGKQYQDYVSTDGLHDLIEVEEKNQVKQLEKENKKLNTAIKENNINIDKVSPEKALYQFIIELELKLSTDQFSNEVAVYKNKYYTINGKEFKSIISEIYFDQKDKVFNDSTWKKVIQVLNARCSHKLEFYPLRCNIKDNKLYYDDGQLVWEFDKGEHKTYDKDNTDCPVIFRRYNHQLPAEVKPNEIQTKNLLQDIINMFNMEDYRAESIPTLFGSEHPNPMGLFTGDPGAAKSTFTLFLKRLVDPDQVEKVSLPDKNNLPDFSMHRQHFYVILYDNIREFTKEQSDHLCMMITGGTGVTRMLYTNGDLSITKGMPRVIGNGIRPEPSNFNDLLDRTLLIDMKRIEGSRPEREIWEKINNVLPLVRYCCLRDLSIAISRPQVTEKELPRMSEYCLIAENISQIWNEEQENNYIDWFTIRMEISHATGMDDPLMIMLEKYLEEPSVQYLLESKEGMKYTGSQWRINLKEWAEEKVNLGAGVYGETKYGGYVRKDMFSLSQEKEFPQNATWMGRRFRDLGALLKVKGYSVSVIRTSDDRYIRITKK